MAHPAVLAMELFPSIRKVDKFIGNPIKKFIDVNNEFLALIEKVYSLSRLLTNLICS